MPHDWVSIAQFLAPLVEKIDGSNRDLQLIIVTPDAEVAAAVSASAVKLVGDKDLQILAATSATRASRLMKIRPPQIVAGSATTLVELLRSASLKVESVKHLCLAWADELLERGDAASLEALMSEIGKDASRTIVTSELTPAIEEIIERYARRARRVAAPVSESAQPTPIEYVTASPSGRLSVVRRILDQADPASAIVFIRDEDSDAGVGDLLRSMGYSSSDHVRVGRVAAPGTALAVLFDLPASREELREAAAGAGRTIAIVQPRQLTSLRNLAAGGMVKPLVLPESGERARSADATLRAEVRSILEDGKFGRELLAVEPLLEDYDGAEIAAAAIVLLERERQAHKAALATIPISRRDPSEMVRLFVTIGTRDGARAGDLVGAMANQGGVSSSEFGKVDIRESHSVIEVSASVADALIERVNGTTIKGRRAVVRRDEQPEGRGARGEGRGGERGPRRESGDRPRGGGDRPRGGPRERSGDRPSRPSSRPSRPPRGRE
jgi:ATP-dependent RNA helicase DeaD